MAEGIADLSYRHYSGALGDPKKRWRVIAAQGLKDAISKRAFWVITLLSSWYYLALIAYMYITQQMGLNGGGPAGAPNPMEELLGRIVWKDQILHGIGTGNLMWMVLTLIIGAGVIANDNRSNSLLIYLSRPCTKFDYIRGKWMGVFMPLLLAMILPSLMFFAYAALSYQDQGFFKQDPWLIIRILTIFPIAAAFHSTLIVGVSSLVKQPKFASAIYAGIYLLSSFAAKMLGVVSIEVDEAPPAMQRFAEAASYCSLDGLIKGAGKLVLGTDGSPMFGVKMGDGPDPSLIPAPTHLLVIVGMGGLAGLALFAAWRRVRAVEVVK